MQVETSLEMTLVHVLPGELIHEAVCRAFMLADTKAATIASCIGSLQSVDWGLASCTDAGVPGPGRRFQAQGAFEVAGLNGHVGLDDRGDPSPHIHGSFFDDEGKCFGGHIFSAAALITLEISLLGSSTVGWERYQEPVNGSAPLPLLRPRRRRE